MLQNVFIPYKGYWSSPFCRWQGTFQNENAIVLGAETAKKFLKLRNIPPDIFDGLYLGMTIGQPSWFYAAPWFAAPNAAMPSNAADKMGMFLFIALPLPVV